MLSEVSTSQPGAGCLRSKVGNVPPARNRNHSSHHSVALSGKVTSRTLEHQIL
jgi:hypothetical protein